MDSVVLTVTPSSAANSVESGGLRVDGGDDCRQPIPAGRMFPTFGWSRIRVNPRHNDADVAKFGNATPYIGLWNGDGNNYIFIHWSAANTIRLAYNASGGGLQAGTWATGGGAIVAGGSYLFEILYTPGQMRLIVDGITRITINAATTFATVPTLLYAGWSSAVGSQLDAVLLAP